MNSLAEAQALAIQMWEDYLSTLYVGEAIPPERVLDMVTELVMSGKKQDCFVASFILNEFADHYR